MLTSETRGGEVRRVLFLVLVFAAAVAGIGARALWDIDEGMHAAMSREMVQTGDWLTPRFNGEPFFDKPVLFTWLCALSMRFLGYSELATRLPGALLGLGTVLATYALGRRTFGPRVGLLGGVVLATSTGFVVFSSVVVHDMCLTFFVTACLVLLHRTLESPDRRRSIFLAASVAAGFAFLAKGPVGVALPAGAVLVYLVLVGRFGLLAKLGIGWGILAFVAVIAPWYVLMGREHPDYLRYFFLEQNVGYLASSESRHPEPFWFYVPALIFLLFPWSFFLPGAVTGALARSRRESEEGRATIFLLSWAAVTFVLFSVAKSKLPGYIVPLMPPLALLLGKAWVELSDAGRYRRTFVVGLGTLFAIIAVGAGYVAVNPLVDLQERYGIDPSIVTGGALGFALVLGIAFVLLLKRRTLASFGFLSLIVIGLFAGFVFGLAPTLDRFRSAKDIARLLDERLPPGEALVSYGDMIGDGDSALFYTGRLATVLEGNDAVREHIDGPERVFALVSVRNAEHIGAQRDRVYVLDRVGRLMVVSDEPDTPDQMPGIPRE